MKCLVLYEELATYFLNCLNYLAEHYDCRVLVIMKQINPIAPFEFDNIHPNLQIEEREKRSKKELTDLIRNFSPDFTYLSGWIHKPYLSSIKKLKLKNVIIGFDNQYNGSWRQKLGALYFRLNYKPFIKAAFVPGEKQVKFAEKLGFKPSCISKNLYCSDYELYNAFAEATIEEKLIQFPKRFLFVGRYIKEKGIQDLWEAFSEINSKTNTGWELWCIGKGPITPFHHPNIKHLGFVQPKDFKDIIKNTGVFVLPSFFEPWGVVLHEFTAAGFPIISTSAVGATEVFLKDGLNGYCINAGNKDSLKKAMKKIVSLNDSKLIQMSAESRELAKKITPALWTQSLLKLVNESIS